MWAAILSVCSSTAISRISKSAVDGAEASWREILYKEFHSEKKALEKGFAGLLVHK